MAGLRVPLSTLRAVPHDTPRMTRGQCGLLRLHCQGLPPFTPCRSPGALLNHLVDERKSGHRTPAAGIERSYEQLVLAGSGGFHFLSALELAAHAVPEFCAIVGPWKCFSRHRYAKKLAKRCPSVLHLIDEQLIGRDRLLDGFIVSLKAPDQV